VATDSVQTFRPIENHTAIRIKQHERGIRETEKQETDKQLKGESEKQRNRKKETEKRINRETDKWRNREEEREDIIETEKKRNRETGK
jgi:hypothetical protein